MGKIKVAQLEILKIKLIHSYHYLRDVSFAHVNILKSTHYSSGFSTLS